MSTETENGRAGGGRPLVEKRDPPDQEEVGEFVQRVARHRVRERTVSERSITIEGDLMTVRAGYESETFRRLSDGSIGRETDISGNGLKGRSRETVPVNNRADRRDSGPSNRQSLT